MADDQVEGHQKRLFAGICLALVPTGAAFAMISNVLDQLKADFVLTNSEVGFIGGMSVAFMALSLLVLGPLLEGYGLKKGLMLAFIGHVSGLTCMLAASAFTDPSNVHIGLALLSIGSVALACGNGMVEVVGNPMVAALYPENKAAKLNLWHGFFPLAIAGAGLLGFGINQLQDYYVHHWTFQLGIVFVPVIIYAIMVLPLKFPKTENAEAGLPVGEMFKYTFTKPAMYGMLILMAIAISLELGTNRWIPNIFKVSTGIPGILLLAWVNLIMFLLRFFASDYLIRWLSPPRLLAIMSVSTCAGLLIFSQVGGGPIAAALVGLLAATLFGAGIAFYFPTIVGLVSERMPRSGSLGIVLTCGAGLAAAGFIGQPQIGNIADEELAQYLNTHDRAQTVALLEGVKQSFPDHIEKAEGASNEKLSKLGYRAPDLKGARDLTGKAIKDYKDTGAIATNATPLALRAIKSAADPKQATEQAEALLGGDKAPTPSEVRELASQGPANAAALAGGILGPAGSHAGKKALLWISWVPLILVVCFGGMYLRDRARGGYKAERLTKESASGTTSKEEEALEAPGVDM